MVTGWEHLCHTRTSRADTAAIGRFKTCNTRCIVHRKHEGMRSTSLRTRSLEPIGNLSQERAYRPYLSSSCVPRVTLTRVSRYANNRTCASDASNDQANDLSHIDDSLSRRQLGLSLVAAPLSAFPAAPTWAKDPEAAVSKARYRESKMVMRALALRGSVPQQWLIDFRAALEGWGIASVSFKPELKDIWKELEGTGGKKNQRTNMDVVTVGDAWLQQAISRGLIQPIGEQELVQQYRYWVCCWNVRARLRQSMMMNISFQFGKCNGTM